MVTTRPRVLIFTATVGEGHDLPARVLAEALRLDADPVVVDALPLLGPIVSAFARSGMRATFGAGRMNWLFDFEYLLFARVAPVRRVAQHLLYLVAGRRLSEHVRRARADVVVSTYPIATEVLGRLRVAGRLPTPVCAAITDLAALDYWAHRGVDLHLVTHHESIDEVERIAGPGSARAVSGLTIPGFLAPPSRSAARRALGVLDGTKVVAVSGGGWGVGDLSGAARIALTVPDVMVVCLCGRNDALKDRLETLFAGESRVRVLGFVDDMAALLEGTDVLVHSTAGLTVLEATMLGCRVVSYGWGIGHIRVNNRAFVRYAIAEVAQSESELRPAIERGLAAPRRPSAARFAELPSAASLVRELARR
jgi:UDP-N-acetylglucosamine:LPS N-acetylglucosamine transferase